VCECVLVSGKGGVEGGRVPVCVKCVYGARCWF